MSGHKLDRAAIERLNDTRPSPRFLLGAAIVFTGLGITDLIRSVRAFLAPHPLDFGNWATLVLGIAFLLGAPYYWRAWHRRRHEADGGSAHR